MAIEESGQRELARNARKTTEHANDILEQVSKIAIYSEDFAVGGKNEAWFQMPQDTATPSPSGNNNGPKFRAYKDTQIDTSIAIVSLETKSIRSTNISTAVAMQTPVENLNVGAYTNKKFDLSTTGEAIEEAVEDSYNNTDYTQGNYEVRRIGNIMGLGLATNTARTADVRTSLYKRDAEEIERVQAILAKGESTRTAVYVSETSHTSLRDDLNTNIKAVSDALKERGINAENLTVKEIDRMIGGQGKHSYGKQNSHFHGGDSRYFKGGARNKVSAATDTVFRRNTGWAGNQRTGIYMDEENRILVTELRHLKNVKNKLEPYGTTGGIEEGVGRRSQRGLRGTARAWAQESMDGSDMGDGYTTVRALNMGAKATAYVGVGISSALVTAGTQLSSLAGQATAMAGKGVTNLAGNIYSIGSQTRKQKWQVQKSSINAKFDAMVVSEREFAKVHQKRINEKTKKSVEFLQQSGWNKTKVVLGKIGDGTKWTVNLIGNSAPVKYIVSGLSPWIQPFKNILATPIGRISNVLKSGANKLIAAKNWILNMKNGIALKIANSTWFKVLRAPFSAFNWVQMQFQKVLIAFGIACLGILASTGLLLFVLMLFTALIPTASLTVGTTGSVSKMLAAESTFINNVVEYHDAHASDVAYVEDCERCSVIPGYVDCTYCNKTGSLSCSNCNSNGTVKKTCSNCNGKGYTTSTIGNVTTLTGCAACGGSGTKVKTTAGTTNNNYKAGSGQMDAVCSSCKGKNDCKTCGGTGKKSCTKCSGYGHITVTTTKKTVKSGCSSCGGSGSIVTDKNGIKNNNFKEGSGKSSENCSSCLGIIWCLDCGFDGVIKEKCTTCNGVGYTTATSGYTTTTTGCKTCGGSGNKVKITAGTTNNNYKAGTGKTNVSCSTCGGTKTVTCNKCNGDGALDEQCTFCEGKGEFVHTVCEHSDGGFSHYPTVTYTGVATNSYSNLSVNTTATKTYAQQDVYKAIMSMGLIVSQWSGSDTLYEDYCEIIMNKFLHSSEITHDITGDGEIVIDTKNSGLTDLMKLEKKVIKCTVPGCCGKTFPSINESWVRQYDDSLDWEGWRAGDNYKNANEWYKMRVSEWEEYGLEIPLANGQLLTTANKEELLLFAQNSLVASDNQERLEVIELALEEMNNLHMYGNTGQREYSLNETLATELDCSSYVLGLLQATGVRAENSGGSTEDIKNFVNSTELRPGDLLLRYNPGHNIADNSGYYNHVMMFIGYNGEGKPMLIECTTDDNDYTYRFGDIYIRTYDSVSFMKLSRGINYVKNPYGD